MVVVFGSCFDLGNFPFSRSGSYYWPPVKLGLFSQHGLLFMRFLVLFKSRSTDLDLVLYGGGFATADLVAVFDCFVAGGLVFVSAPVSGGGGFW
jgi:hypothetical protein